MIRLAFPFSNFPKSSQMINSKERVIQFLRVAPKADDHCFSFTLEGTEVFAAGYIHNMRVALAKLRNRLRNQGKQIKQFKMLVKKCYEVDGVTQIVLRYKDSDINALSEDLTDLFSVLADENQTIDDREVRGLQQSGLKPIVLERFNVKTS